MTNYLDSVSTPRQHSQLNQQHTLQQLLHRQCTSSWGRDQLVACRVLVRGTNANLLPVLAEPALQDTNTHITQTTQLLEGLVRGPTLEHANTTDKSEFGYVTRYGPSLGPVWAALHRLKVDFEPMGTDAGMDDSTEMATDNDIQMTVDKPESTVGHAAVGSSPPWPAVLEHAPSSPTLPTLPRPGPLSAPPTSAGFRPTRSDVSRMRKVDPAMVASNRHYGSSSTTASQRASSPTPDDPEYISSAESRRSPHHPEDLTIRFTNVFFRHVLYTANTTESDIRVDFDDARRQLAAKAGTAGIAFTSIDDGGLRVVTSDHCVGRIAILEAKASPGPIIDGRSAFPDTWLAQIVGESLASRLTEGKHPWAGPKDRVFVVAAARYFLRFFELEITNAYLEQLGVHMTATDDVPVEEYIKIDATRMFDLRQESGRRNAIMNIAGLVALADKCWTGEIS